MCQVTQTDVNPDNTSYVGLFVQLCWSFVGLYKKCRCSWRGRVRQKPLSIVQLDLFEDLVNERLYVRSSKKRPSYESWSFKTDVFWRSSVDSSNECS